MKHKILYINILISFLFLHSCITFDQSTLSVIPEQNIEIGACRISFTGPVYMNWFGIVKSDFMSFSMKVEYDSLIVFVDPLYIAEGERADYIFITHSHIDHCHAPDIQKLHGEETLIIGPEPVARKLKQYKVKTVFVGEQIDLDNISYEVVDAYNTRSKIHKKDSKSVGYVINCDSVRIYIAGDTDLIPKMEGLEDIDLAVLPIGVGKTAMDPVSAAEAANIIRPGIVVPVHYNFGKGAEELFLEHLDDEVEVWFYPVNAKQAP